MEHSKYFNFAKQVFELSQQWPEKIAYIDDSSSITYQELEFRARSFASYLHDRGLSPEDRVLVAMIDCIDLPVVLLGCILGGYVAVLCNPRSNKNLMCQYVNLSNPKVIVTSSVSNELIIDILKEQSDTSTKIVDHAVLSNIRSLNIFYNSKTTLQDSVAYWLFTSGGSGEPKAVVHVHGSMYEVGVNLGIKVWDFNYNDIVYVTAKMFFAYGLCYAFQCPLLVGATCILQNKMATPHSILQIFKTHNPSIFATVPSGYVGLNNSGLDLTNLGMRFCISAGEALPETVHKLWETTTSTELYNLYGTTEFTGALLTNRKNVKKQGTVGKPVPGYECEVRKDNGQLCETGEIGDLYLKGPSLGLWYHNDLKKSRETFQGNWCYSGDKFIKDKDGFFKFIGRSNDMFKVDANWVSPIEIENIIAQHELVQEVGVVGIEDKDGLLKPHAFMVLVPGSIAPINFEYHIKKMVRKHIEHYKTPKSVNIVTELPKNTNGKLERYKLKGLVND